MAYDTHFTESSGWTNNVTPNDADHVADLYAEIGDRSDPALDSLTVTAQFGIIPAVAVADADKTLALTDAGKVIEMNSSTSRTVTVPPNSSVAFPVGTVLEVYRQGTGNVTIAAGGGVTVRNAGSISAQYASCSLRKRDTDEWVVTGEVA